MSTKSLLPAFTFSLLVGYISHTSGMNSSQQLKRYLNYYGKEAYMNNHVLPELKEKDITQHASECWKSAYDKVSDQLMSNWWADRDMPKPPSKERLLINYWENPNRKSLKKTNYIAAHTCASNKPIALVAALGNQQLKKVATKDKHISNVLTIIKQEIKSGKLTLLPTTYETEVNNIQLEKITAEQQQAVLDLAQSVQFSEQLQSSPTQQSSPTNTKWAIRMGEWWYGVRSTVQQAIEDETIDLNSRAQKTRVKSALKECACYKEVEGLTNIFRAYHKLGHRLDYDTLAALFNNAYHVPEILETLCMLATEYNYQLPGGNKLLLHMIQHHKKSNNLAALVALCTLYTKHNYLVDSSMATYFKDKQIEELALLARTITQYTAILQKSLENLKVKTDAHTGRIQQTHEGLTILAATPAHSVAMQDNTDQKLTPILNTMQQLATLLKELDEPTKQ